MLWLRRPSSPLMIFLAIVSVGRETVLGQLALDGEGALQLPGHQLERIGLQGAAEAHEQDPDGPGLADASGPARSLSHGVSRPASVSAW